MVAGYQELKTFKYEANLLYTKSVLKQEKIGFEVDDTHPCQLLVKTEDYSNALKIISKLDLDESEVSEESDDYMQGYNEWIKNQFVPGYFTVGKIPLWMFSKNYAKFYGPFLIISALFWAPVNTITGEGFKETPSIILLLLYVLYLFCGIMLTIRGFKKQ